MKKKYSFKNTMLNSNGFALAETLIVSLFLMIIFTMIFTNIVPIVGEYERRENYDTVDGKYKTYWIKKMIEDVDYNLDTTSISNNKYVVFDCENMKEEKRDFCNKLLIELGSNKIYITDYTIGKSGENNYFQNIVKENSSKEFSKKMQDYVRLLPNYSAESVNGAKYRVIASYKNDSYATMEVLR